MSEARTTYHTRATGMQGTIGIEKYDTTGQLALRGDMGNGVLVQAVQTHIGVAIPTIWQTAFSGDKGAVWMAPDEILLLVDYREAKALADQIGQSLADQHALVVDMSDARTRFRLRGARVAEVLAKGAPVDLSPDAFPVGRSRRTHIAGIAVAFWRRDSENWDIVCFRSVAHHLLAWLKQASVPGSEIWDLPKVPGP